MFGNAAGNSHDNLGWVFRVRDSRIAFTRTAKRIAARIAHRRRRADAQPNQEAIDVGTVQEDILAHADTDRSRLDRRARMDARLAPRRALLRDDAARRRLGGDVGSSAPRDGSARTACRSPTVNGVTMRSPVFEN